MSTRAEARRNKKNAFLLFAEVRKKEMEAEGFKFMDGMKEVVSMVAADWNVSQFAFHFQVQVVISQES